MIRIDRRLGHFVDEEDRVCLLRGVNLSGSSKLPYCETSSRKNTKHFHDFQFQSSRSISFVNRPFPLAEADEHFQRLQQWGLHFIRLIVTWEAIEHSGPGIYDKEYLKYIHDVVEKAHEYGLLIYIDPHQDVWSRWTGGDGAPMWTLYKCGLDSSKFADTKAALCHQDYFEPQDFPKMIWPTNYFKFACATMFTLFWAGSTYAPSLKVESIPVQEYLQSHYINSLVELAKELKDLPNVVGFGTMNEPSAGYIGVKDLSKHFIPSELKYNFAPTPFEGMCLASGIHQCIEWWSNGLNQHVLGRCDSTVNVCPESQKGCWLRGSSCIWEKEGVWERNADNVPSLLKPDYFANVDFGSDFYVPFAQKFANAIRMYLPDAILFVELPPLEFSHSTFPNIPPTILSNAVNATHWYDGVTLFTRSWKSYFTVDTRTRFPVFGSGRVHQTHVNQLKDIQFFGVKQMKGAPTLIGECGIPFNLSNGKAYQSDDFSAQTEALNNTIMALEANLLPYTIWCYSPDNCNALGDQWNLEDLSIFSRDQVTNPKDLNSGARALKAFSRPCAIKISGLPRKSMYNMKTQTYVLEFESFIDSKSNVTEVFFPNLFSHEKSCIVLSAGSFQVIPKKGWTLIKFYHNLENSSHSFKIMPLKAVPEELNKNFYVLFVALFFISAICYLSQG